MVQNEFEEVAKGWFWVVDDIFVPDDVNWDLGFEPEIMKVFPNGDILLDEFRPELWELLEIIVADRFIMAARTDHVVKAGDAVERVPDQEDGSLGVELGLSVPLRIVRFDDPNTFVNQSLASEAHIHEILVQLFGDIAIGTTRKPGNFF